MTHAEVVAEVWGKVPLSESPGTSASEVSAASSVASSMPSTGRSAKDATASNGVRIRIARRLAALDRTVEEIVQRFIAGDVNGEQAARLLAGLLP